MLSNQKLLNLSKKEVRLRTMERRNESIINVLKKECQKLGVIAKPEAHPVKQPWKLKKLRSDYTFKLPEKAARDPQPLETFKHGWKVKSEMQIPQRVKELTEKRSKMILVGNAFSVNNKAPSETTVTGRKVSKSKSLLDTKREITLKGKEMGNRYSQNFMSRHMTSDANPVDRYHSLMTRKTNVDKNNQKCVRSGNKPSESFSKPLQTLIDDFSRYEEDCAADGNFNICHESQ